MPSPISTTPLPTELTGLTMIERLVVACVATAPPDESSRFIFPQRLGMELKPVSVAVSALVRRGSIAPETKNGSTQLVLLVDPPKEWISELKHYLTNTTNNLYKEDVLSNNLKKQYHKLDIQKKIIVERFTAAIDQGYGNAVNVAVEALLHGEGPFEAPELYKERQDRSETIVDFINRVYGEWLDGHFTRADLGRLDKSAERAVRDAQRNIGQLPRNILNLPTLEQRFNEIVTEGEHPNVKNLRALASRTERREKSTREPS